MITIDLDKPTVAEITYAWRYVKWYGGDGPYGRISSGKDGIHIKSDWEIPEDTGIEAYHRRKAGDDPYRIRGDKWNDIESNQVLYDRKGADWAGPWCNDLNTLLKTWSHTRRERV